MVVVDDLSWPLSRLPYASDFPRNPPLPRILFLPAYTDVCGFEAPQGRWDDRFDRGK